MSDIKKYHKPVDAGFVVRFKEPPPKPNAVPAEAVVVCGVPPKPPVG